MKICSVEDIYKEQGIVLHMIDAIYTYIYIYIYIYIYNIYI